MNSKNYYQTFGMLAVLLLLTNIVHAQQVKFSIGQDMKLSAVNGNISADSAVINTGGTLDANGSTLRLFGAGAPLINNGTFTSTSSTLAYNGGAAQSTTAGVNTQTLEINNAAGVTLASSLSLSGGIAFTNGNLLIGTSNIVIGGSATVTGAGIGKSIVTNGTGSVSRPIAAGAANAFQFPVSPITTSYNPLTIELRAGDPTETFSVRIDPFTNASPGFATTDTSFVVWRVWDIGEATAGGNHARLTFQWNNNEDGSNIGPPTLLGAYHYDSGTSRYNLIDNASGPGGNPIVVQTSSAFLATTFSAWIVGNSSALPVQLASFTATEVPNRGVRLRWTTLSEINNYGFHVQRKRVGDSTFTELANSFIAGYGTTNEPHSYTFSDSSVSRGSWSYRLKQVDLDGTVHFTEAVQVSVITDVKETAPEAGRYYKVKFDASNSASGMYIYRLQSGKRSDVKKLILLK